MRHLPSGIGPHLCLLGEIGLGDGVGDAHRLVRVAAGDVDLDHVSALVAVHLDAPLQLVERGQRPAAGKVVPAQQDAEQRRSAHEFRIVVETLGSDDAAEHRVRGEHTDLTVDLEQRGVVCLRGLRIGADRAQVARVNKDLRDRGVFARRQCDVDDRQGEGREHAKNDCGPPAPQHGPDFAEVDLCKRRRRDGKIAVADDCRSDLARRLEHCTLECFASRNRTAPGAKL